nr:hypothetical protein [uncultured Rhodopila sp.]
MTAAAITQAHVSGPLGQALAVIGGETWLYEAAGRRRPSHNDIQFFFNRGLEVRPIGQPVVSDLEGILDEETRKFRALHGVLYGLDADLDDATRSREMRRASGLLADWAVAGFVACRFLRPPDKAEWDIARGLELARRADLPLIVRLYAIVDGPILGWVEDTIREWASKEGFGAAARAELVAQSYANGLVAATANAIYDNDQPRTGTLLFEADTTHWDSGLVGLFAKQLTGSMRIDAGPSFGNQDTVADDRGMEISVQFHMLPTVEVHETPAKLNSQGQRALSVLRWRTADSFLGMEQQQVGWAIRSCLSGWPTTYRWSGRYGIANPNRASARPTGWRNAR